MNETPTPPSPSVTRILWVALLVSQLVYLAIPTPRPAEGAPQIFVLALAAVAASEAMGVVFLFRFVCVPKVQSGELDPSTLEGAGRLFTFLIICWVLAESIAIYGLVLRFLGATPPQWAPFALVGFVLMAVVHPWSAGLQPAADPNTRGSDPTPIG